MIAVPVRLPLAVKANRGRFAARPEVATKSTAYRKRPAMPKFSHTPSPPLFSRGDATPTQARVFLIETSAADIGKHLADVLFVIVR